jgi:hypothetical protein
MDGAKAEWFRARTGGHKRTLVTVTDRGTSGSEEETPPAPEQGEAPQPWEEFRREIARQAQELQTAAARMAAQDEAIRLLKEEVASLKEAAKPTEATAKAAGTTKAAKAVMTAKTAKGDGATPTTAGAPPKHTPQPRPQHQPQQPQQAWRGPNSNPAPLMQMIRGKAKRVEEAPRAPSSRKEAREEDVTLFKQGMARAGRGLKTLYIKGVARMPYGRLREILKKLGIPAEWVRNLAFAGVGTLEMLVFGERAEEIQAIILKDAPALGAAPDFDPLRAEDKEVAQRVGRLERDLKRLPPQMHMVRRELAKKLQEAKARLQKTRAAATTVAAATAAVAAVTEDNAMPVCEETEAPVVGTEMLADKANV